MVNWEEAGSGDSAGRKQSPVRALGDRRALGEYRSRPGATERLRTLLGDRPVEGRGSIEERRSGSVEGLIASGAPASRRPDVGRGGAERGEPVTGGRRPGAKGQAGGRMRIPVHVTAPFEPAKFRSCSTTSTADTTLPCLELLTDYVRMEPSPELTWRPAGCTPCLRRLQLTSCKSEGGRGEGGPALSA